MRIKAFTLIELLIVVAIIAILAAIAVPNFLEAQTRSKVSRVKADMRTVNTAMECYAADWGKPIWCFGMEENIASHAFLRMEWEDGGHHFGIPEYFGSPLTTPVAYITSIPFDPFTTIAWGNQPEKWWKPWKPRNTSFMMAYGAKWDWLRDIYGANETIPILFKDVGYVFYSAGPACYLAWSPPVGYDPTNGTTSVGNIFYVRGAGFYQTTRMGG